MRIRNDLCCLWTTCFISEFICLRWFKVAFFSLGIGWDTKYLHIRVNGFFFNDLGTGFIYAFNMGDQICERRKDSKEFKLTKVKNLTLKRLNQNNIHESTVYFYL